MENFDVYKVYLFVNLLAFIYLIRNVNISRDMMWNYVLFCFNNTYSYT